MSAYPIKHVKHDSKQTIIFLQYESEQKALEKRFKTVRFIALNKILTPDMKVLFNSLYYLYHLNREVENKAKDRLDLWTIILGISPSKFPHLIKTFQYRLWGIIDFSHRNPIPNTVSNYDTLNEVTNPNEVETEEPPNPTNQLLLKQLEDIKQLINKEKKIKLVVTNPPIKLPSLPSFLDDEDEDDIDCDDYSTMSNPNERYDPTHPLPSTSHQQF